MTLIGFLLALFKLGSALLKRSSDAKLREAGWNEATVAGFRALMTTMEKANAVDQALLDDDLDSDWVRRIRDRASGRKPDPDSAGSDGATPGSGE